MSELCDLTGANSTVTISLPFMPNPVELEGFRIDGSITASAPNFTNSVFTLDGKKLDSLTYEEMTLSINLMPTSKSIDLFVQWRNMMYLSKSSLNTGILSITINSLGKRYIYKNCALRSNPSMPALAAQLDAVEIVLSCHPLPDVIEL